ncbi:OLC1v1028129C2 [Oldenlandia corymbosa var. corymbosa]|uniref:OLC1v1028129C2 n=1 Tax=Oldenlandia corymbosa var. corymbosa TaxID=529605 RepID=A0AAV1CBS4_OLDCO|nr:OLC1v1028129C2 [Oldenlandia corymbosa var. corymbosa]
MGSLSRQSSMSSDLKTRVITCLNKLSDRDTLALATNELEFIARTLDNDDFAPFLNCLSTTDSSEKSPVRRQCVRMLGVLSASHGDALSPHLSKMLSSVLRRIRDPDSSVRSACVDAVSCIASHVTRPPFSLISKPLIECICREQDYNAQIGASLCLAAAIEASPEPEPAELKKLLPKLLKLVKNDSFKAKPALLSLIGSIVSVGGASSRNVLISLVPALVEFLSNDDWSARKSAADALGRLAEAESNLLSEFKSSCLASIESKRFDKVKVVRETMNRAMELWKDVPGVSDVASNDNGSDDNGYITPQQKKTIARVRSPVSNKSSNNDSNQKRSPPKNNIGKPKASRSFKMDPRKPLDYKVEINVPQNDSLKLANDEQKNQKLEASDSDSADTESCKSSKVEVKCFPFNRSSDERAQKFSGSRFGTRVVPLHGNGNYSSNAVDTNTGNVAESQQEFESISLIQKQLRQIESQQSSLMDLLQRFIGHSQNGMSSLERRVNGLEKALGGMSHDLAISTAKISNSDAAGNTCCMLPGAEF